MPTREWLIEQSGRSEQELYLLAAVMLARHGDQAEERLEMLANSEMDREDTREAAVWLAAATFLEELRALQGKHVH